MKRLHDALEFADKPVRQGAQVVIYFPATGTDQQSTAILPMWKAKVLRYDSDALVVLVGKQTIALSWDHIAGLSVV